MKRTMAYPPGMLVRKDGNIRYQYRIPKDLKQYYSKAVMSENLGTTDKALAARLINRRRAELDQEFAKHRSAKRDSSAPPRTSISDKEAADLAKCMLASSTAADEEIRHEGLIDVVFAPESFVDTQSPLSREAIKRAAAKGDYSAFTSVVSDWLNGNGYALDPRSSDFRKVAREFAKAASQVMEIVGRRDEGEFVDSPSIPVISAAGGTAAQSSSLEVLTLSKVIKYFLANCDKAAAMYKKHQAALSLLLESIGDIAVTEIRQLNINSYFDMLSRLPPRWSDVARRTGMRATDLAKQEHPVTLSPKTFEFSYMASIRLFLADAKRVYGDAGFPIHLTVVGIRYKGNQKDGAHKQRAFAKDELKRLFEGAEYGAFARDPEQASYYWLPMIALYTGARVNEICQLNPECDIREEGGIWFFDFTEESDGDVRVKKSVKNEGSRRKTPIHSELIKLGFLSYVDRVRANGARLLFPLWTPTRGRASPAAEKWFRELLRETGLRDETPGRRLAGVHAFRHTLLHVGYNLHVADIEVITGHAGNASAVVRGYRGEMSLENKQDILEKIRFDIDPPVPVSG